MSKIQKRKLKRPFKGLLVMLLSIILLLGISQITDKRVGTISNFTVNIETEMEDTKDFTYFISVPSFDNDEVNKPIHEWISNQKREFLQDLDENSKVDNRSHLNIKVDIEEVNHELYNIILESYQYTGGANGINTIQTFTVDIQNQKLLSIHDILKEKSKAADELHSFVEKELKGNEETKIYVFDDLIEEAFQQLDDLKWSINHHELSLYFNQYEIAAGAMGIVKVDVPLEHIHSILTEDLAMSVPEVEEVPADSNQVDSDDDQEKKTEEDEVDSDEASGEDTALEELDPEGKYVALTFDDGPSESVTPRILKTLDEYKAKATFFMLGSQVDRYPDMAKTVADQGHEIANHTLNHLDLTAVNLEEAKKEISKSRTIIKEVTGHDPLLMRPPYGAYNDSIVNQTTGNDESIILWSVDSLDWKSRNAQAIQKTILDTVTAGSVILMHDIHKETADALPSLLQRLKEEGYEFITVSQMLKLQEVESVDLFYGNYK